MIECNERPVNADPTIKMISSDARETASRLKCGDDATKQESNRVYACVHKDASTSKHILWKKNNTIDTHTLVCLIKDNTPQDLMPQVLHIT